MEPSTQQWKTWISEKRYRWISRIAIPVVLIAVAGFACQKGDFFSGEVLAESPLKGKHQGSPVYELQKTFNEVADLYSDRVVFISTEKTIDNPIFNDPFFKQFFGPNQGKTQQKQTGLGTGFIISNDGYICTNHHVIKDMDRVTVNIGDTEHDAKIIGSDPMTDIALLKVEGVSNLNPVYFGDSDRVHVGDWAIAIGNPFGLDRSFTVGVISAIARRDVDQLGNTHIQTDASINPGNSGGPLLNIDGEVIGVNRMIYSRSGGYMGIGFAIPINTAKDILDQLKKSGSIKRGYLGVQIAPVSGQIAQKLGLPAPEGALVTSVVPDSPAHDAGIQQKDVIIQMDQTPIKSPSDLVREAGKAKIGKSYRFVLYRDGKKTSLSVRIKERPLDY